MWSPPNDHNIMNDTTTTIATESLAQPETESYAEKIFNEFMNDQSSSLPLGVPSEDDEEGGRGNDQFHSLPSAEELKASITAGSSIALSPANGNSYDETMNGDDDDDNVNMGSSSDGKLHDCQCTTMWRSLFVLIVLGLVLGLSFGLTQDQRSSASTTAATFHGGDERLNHMINYLIANGVSSSETLLDEMGRSAQFQAVDWMAHDDGYEIGIPVDGNDLSSKAGYDFVVRYVMAVLYYTTKGKSWIYDLSFLSDKPTCEWSQVFAPPVGQVGVLCNQITQQMVGLSLGEPKVAFLGWGACRVFPELTESIHSDNFHSFFLI